MTIPDCRVILLRLPRVCEQRPDGQRMELLPIGEAFQMRSIEAERYRKLYATNDWKRLRKAKLQRNPLCERCAKFGYVIQATVVHHLEAHKGESRLFFDMNNLQSLCKPHHDGEAQSEEIVGYSRAVDAEGWPTDPKHPVNKYDLRNKNRR